MALLGRFSTDTIEVLGKRAALTCSNPDCGALTSGPTIHELGSVNIGEAAHIFGLTPRSARYTASLSTSELGDITNAIWLCRNCHKSIDNDELRFPVDLLFQWRRLHEAAVLERLGKPGERLREKIKSDQLQKFADTSFLAQQIILDRPPHWEYKLTLEILREELGPTAHRWDQLKRGMYVRRATLVSADHALEWLNAAMTDNSKMVL
ncbi:HNH endonuclease [Tardiphaga sp. 866_E4_N2_1]|uniref:HNH endonuclease n=1 Tax=unclassified Tardiphaga TaxID=2631404 RepID=UPI003F28EEF1